MTVLDETITCIPALRRYAHALLRDREGADDLVQDCLERGLARRRHWRGDGLLRAWLFRILLNRYRDGLRSAAGRAHLVSLDLMAVPAQSGGQDAHLALREVHDAMGRLPALSSAVISAGWPVLRWQIVR